MFYPGKKNWIKKFFSLVDRNEIDLQVNLSSETDDVEEQIREVCEHTGILYGVPNQNLYTTAYVSAATRNEKLQVLLMESLLYIYQLHQKGSFNPDAFIYAASEFYQTSPLSKKLPWNQLLGKRDATHNLEQFLADRIKVHSSYNDTNFWFNHLTNGFLYIDLILFHRYCESGQVRKQGVYNELVAGVLKHILSVKFQNPHEDRLFDGNMYKNLLLSSELTESDLTRITGSETTDGAKDEALMIFKQEPMLRKFTFQFVVLLYHEFPSESYDTDTFLFRIGTELGINPQEISDIFWECRKSMSAHSSEFFHLISESESKILVTQLARKYNRILWRNKDKLIRELKESKELIYLVGQASKRELSPEEKEKVRTQSMDLMKSVPSIGIFLIPGGALWLPLVLKLIPDLLPSAFKENEVEEKK